MVHGRLILAVVVFGLNVSGCRDVLLFSFLPYVRWNPVLLNLYGLFAM
jgi:hypothetical protein